MTTVVFGQAELAEFAEASHDRNPLHVSEEYARATTYGEPVVYGVLAALPLLGTGAPGPHETVRAIELSFVRPVFTGRAYQVAAEREGDRHTARLLDVDGPAVKAVVTYGRGELEESGEPVVPDGVQRCPLDPHYSEFETGRHEDGDYRAGPAAATLTTRYGLLQAGLGSGDIEALLWASFYSGMRVPGRQALLSRIRVDLPQKRPGAGAGMRYRAEISRLDSRMHLVQVDGVVRRGGRTVAETTVRTFWRPPVARPTMAEIQASLEDLPPAGRGVAVVVGASRGVGAALTLSLAHQGYEVTGFYQASHSRAEEVRAAAPESVRMVCGDAGDPAWCARMAADLDRSHGAVEVLACVAAPPLHPLRLSGDSLARVTDYVSRSLCLVAAPLTAFLPLLARARGKVLAVSSESLTDPRADWPHYTAAKSAIEGLIAATVPAYPAVTFHVVRLPRIATEYVESLNPAIAAISPATAATNLLRLIHPGPHQSHEPEHGRGPRPDRPRPGPKRRPGPAP